MKKQLKQELIALAERILEIKEQKKVSTLDLKQKAQNLYEKLTLLHYTEKTIAAPETEEHQPEFVAANPQFEESVKPADKKKAKAESAATSKNDKTEEEYDDYAPDGTQYNEGEAITEPNTEKIKDIVAQMPPESQGLEEMLEHILPKKHQKNDMEDIGGVHYDKLPQFEPVNHRTAEPEKPKSLNDRLKKGIQIGLNDRLAFVKHLFDGSTTDYNRVLSQLNTIKTKSEATDFVLKMVKPDYNNWQGKEEYEIRFLALIENKFE
ncbi:MAG TPA: hypothetical protein VFM59_07405 [Salinimicrobium sp.]|nr:hypothetical protein [Salinimicrobium sp.]